MWERQWRRAKDYTSPSPKFANHVHGHHHHAFTCAPASASAHAHTRAHTRAHTHSRTQACIHMRARARTPSCVYSHSQDTYRLAWEYAGLPYHQVRAQRMEPATGFQLCTESIIIPSSVQFATGWWSGCFLSVVKLYIVPALHDFSISHPTLM